MLSLISMGKFQKILLKINTVDITTFKKHFQHLYLYGLSVAECHKKLLAIHPATADNSSTRNKNFTGPQHSANRGIAVTSASGVHNSHQQPPSGPATFQPTQLPPYLATSNGYPLYPQANGHVSNGYQQQQLGKMAQLAHVPQRHPIGVSNNPMGRGVRMAPGAVNGSVDTLNTTDGDNTSMLSFGSTGSYSSAGDQS